ncbi:GNAT family N-acetyltransferase [Streptomyces sp. NBC_01022]|uniref:GNAT family N-acetyltransferase n=1 Tax=Streptomyces sp. NBC_01022 TaxID=2903723 RepID=UPI002DDAC0BD|nr:GNAT family N-acetyltransferase [Streptomyces sp. NBC_01022]WRZ79593.1 GNAT family N-acetyltransferase [Streptomyces sp. NBC_01022]
MRYFGLDILAFADELTEAYVEIFTAPPWEHRDAETTRAAFRERLETDAQRPGFRALLAMSENGEVEGFVTGWATPTPFRTDRAYGKVTRRLGTDRANELLVGAFEIDELGVRSQARGTGLGRRLLSALTDAAPSGRAWLLAWNQAHDTLEFYRRIGWQEPEPIPGNETDIVVFLSPS